MRKLIGAGLAVLGFAASVSAQAATVIFTDSFDGYTPSLAWDGSNVWTTGNSVDLVANNTFGLNCAGGTGNCVDLSGSSPGFSSKSFTLDPGTYLLEFDYTGNQLGAQFAQAGFNVSLGSFSQFVGPLSNTSKLFQHFAQYVNVVGNPTTLSFNQVGGDNFRGSIIDNASITAVPEPATWLSLIAGFGMLGFAMRRRKTGTMVSYA